MTCEQAKMRMTDAQDRELAAHLDSCESCRNEMNRIGALWQSLDLLPLEEPSGQVRERFYEMLGAYRQGLSSAEARKEHRWWQTAAAAALLAAGLGIGYAARGNGQPPAPTPGEVSQLREELASMRQLVALSLLQQQSASERLRGVSWAYQAEPSDREVLGALVTAVNHDTSVNVRLAAVDALRRFAASPETRRAVVEALPSETTPLVQVALIDLLVDFKDRDATGVLKTLAANRDANDEVRQQAQWALERLQ